MPISQQNLHSIKIHNLKNIVDLTVTFDGSPVTVILGPNGNGKSTVLHALACLFKPVSDGENYKFSSFFLPSTDALWQGSHLEICHSYRDGRNTYENIKTEYSKTSDRWSPKYTRRPSRDIYFIGIEKCVPLIESENKVTRINYSTETISESLILEILSKASYILNKQYSAFNMHTASGKQFIGVESGGLRYSALSMSAGEQKIFYILQTVFRAQKSSLILIDEIDLLLHDGALKRLIDVIYERASDKNLQVITTTHRESIIDQGHLINVRHIVVKSNRSLCFNETKPDAINRLTGNQPRPIEVFVEDDLALAIVKKLAGELGGTKYVAIERFGAAINCFTVISGLLLGGEECNSSLFVIDGDVYRTVEEKQERIRKVLAGDDPRIENLRARAVEKIRQFSIPPNVNPEKYIHSLIIGMTTDENPEYTEIIECAREINAVADDHKYIDDLIFRLDWDKNVGLAKVVDLVAMSEQWPEYVADVKNWLQKQIEENIENSDSAL